MAWKAVPLQPYPLGAWGGRCDQAGELDNAQLEPAGGRVWEQLSKKARAFSQRRRAPLRVAHELPNIDSAEGHPQCRLRTGPL